MTEYVALFGDPVEGNPTSRMHNAAFRYLRLDWHYLDVRVLPADLGDAVAAVRVLRFSGLNVTLPHKVTVIPHLDDLERSARMSLSLAIPHLADRVAVGYAQHQLSALDRRTGCT